jgi:hypothetical protein
VIVLPSSRLTLAAFGKAFDSCPRQPARLISINAHSLHVFIGHPRPIDATGEILSFFSFCVS